MGNYPHIYVQRWNAVTPLGKNISDIYTHMLRGESSCRIQTDKALFPEQICASLFGNDFTIQEGFSRLETLILQCLTPILSPEVAQSEKTVFIFSSTKGNIDAVVPGLPIPQSAYLWHTANKIARHFGNPNKAITISTACVSGILAQNTGFDLLRMGAYEHAVVFGADIVTSFVLSGFGSFKAMSPEPSKPFDKNRIGINLGEGSGAVILSLFPGNFPVKITGTGSSNDANHISGPSRDGGGLSLGIRSALAEAGILSHEVDFISAHGTATPYNDEMESLAFANSGLSSVPLNSMKGFFGHTLGAAGLVETAVLLQSMKEGIIPTSRGFAETGVSGNINVLTSNLDKKIRKAIKTGSGFGGCNAVSVFEA